MADSSTGYLLARIPFFNPSAPCCLISRESARFGTATRTPATSTAHSPRAAAWTAHDRRFCPRSAWI